jgi:hypothetical protein
MPYPSNPTPTKEIKIKIKTKTLSIHTITTHIQMHKLCSKVTEQVESGYTKA